MPNLPNLEDTQPLYHATEAPSPAGSPVDSRCIDALSRTKPWVRFMAVMGFIMVGFTLLAALFMLGMGLFAGEFSELGAAQGFAMCLMYIVAAVIYGFPTVALWKYGTAINTASMNTTHDTFFTALEKQRSFWKIVGIITLIWLILIIVIIIAAIIISVVAVAATV